MPKWADFVIQFVREIIFSNEMRNKVGESCVPRAGFLKCTKRSPWAYLKW